jgi:hypothetical protein
VVVFNKLTVDVPVMEIVQSGIKMAVKCFHVGIVLVVIDLHPLYLCSIFLASLSVMAEMCANVPADICSARVFRGSAGIGVALAHW